MLRHEKSAPIWLFSFVDLAFLLLIAFTQISPPGPLDGVDLAQIEVPRIESPGSPLDGPAPVARWQLRVHAAEEVAANAVAMPFQLVAPGMAVAGGDDERARAQRIPTAALGPALEDLFAQAAGRPLLTPHPDARAEDLLVAVGFLSEIWQRTPSAAVRPRPAVAGGPPRDPGASSLR